MNSDSPLNWDKITNTTLPSNDNISEITEYPSLSYNSIILIIIILLSLFICIFIYQQLNIYNPNINTSCDDDDYNKWN